MARQKGTANLAASLEVLAGAPLDARSLVDTVADLTVTSNFPYPYVGMTVTVKATGDKYVLMALPVSKSANWKKQGGSDITVDDTLSNVSENPVQNKVITNAIANKADLVDGKIPASQLPSYVDDVINGYLYEGDFYEDDQHTEQIEPEDDKIYVDLTEDKTYRWSGLEYVEVGGGGVALGETASTAYRGDRGKTAYDISQTVGDVTNLQTTEKSTVVGAINEAIDFDTNVNRPQKGITPISDVITPLPGVKPRVMKYSTDEQIVGEWIDGKPIYQKTVNCGALPNTTEKSITHGISNLKRCIDARGYAHNPSSEAMLPIPYVGHDATSYVNLSVNATTIFIGTAKDRSSITESYVTLLYTKVTD